MTAVLDMMHQGTTGCSALGNGMLADTCVMGPSSHILAKRTGIQGPRDRDGL